MSFDANSVGRARLDEGQRVLVDHEELRGVDFSARELTQFSASGPNLTPPSRNASSQGRAAKVFPLQLRRAWHSAVDAHVK